MSSAPPVEHFKGNGWEECDDFILSMHKRAFWEGKQRDSAWMADFAATNFSRKARLWHSQLPEDVRQDWSKLEAALLDRWPPPDDEEGPHIQPTPAAAPSIDPNNKSNRTLQGFLKLVLDGSNTNYFVTIQPGGVGFITTDRNKAIRVRCNSVSGVVLLERIDQSCSYCLAVHWSDARPRVESGSNHHAYLACIDLRTLKSTWSNDGPYQLLACTLAADDEVTPVWTKDDESKMTLCTFIDPSVEGSVVYIAVDPEAYSKAYKSERRTKFFIEHID